MSARSTLIRDMGAWLVAGAILLKQAGILFPPPAEVNDTLCIVAATLFGGPGVLHGISALRGGTEPPSSPSPGQAPSVSSPGESSPNGSPV